MGRGASRGTILHRQFKNVQLSERYVDLCNGLGVVDIYEMTPISHNLHCFEIFNLFVNKGADIKHIGAKVGICYSIANAQKW
jgi:hypothetical protein